MIKGEIEMCGHPETGARQVGRVEATTSTTLDLSGITLDALCGNT